MSVPTNLIPTLITGLQEYTGSSTLGYMPYILDGRTYKVQFANIAAVGAVPSSRVIAAGTGLAGGGDLSANRVISIANGGVGFDQLALSGVTQGTYGSGSAIPILTVDAKGRVTSATTAPLDVTGFVPTSRTITAGDGLTGGGALTSNVTLAANFSAATPSALGTASAGTAITVSRGDHVHPAVNLSDTSQTQGALPLGRGGTGDALSPVAGAVVYSTGSKFALTNPGIVGQVLVSGGTDEPQWQTVLGTGTVTSVSVSTANGFAGFVANPATVPDITLSTTVTGMLKGDGTGMSAATAGIDYVEPGPYTTSGLTMASARLLGRTTASVGAAQEITVGTGLTLSGGSLINAAPDQTVSLTAGTAISISGTYPSFTITNTAPDQVVSLTGAGTTTVTGTYPSFTITSNDSTSGTVTSVNASGGTTGMSFTGGPITSAGTLTLNGTLAVANGGTGATDAATALTNLGAYPASNPAGYTTNVGTVTSVSGTGTVSGLTLSGTVTSAGSLTLGGTLAVTPSNFASQTANTVLAAPNGSAGVPTFRAIVAADVPTLNQNTTGTASNVTGIVAVANGGTGASVAGTARTNLGAAASGANTDITSIALTTGTISTSPVNGTDIVNKLYADSIASGINFHQSVRLATAAALPANTYNNGTSGVGATLTGNANGALSVDGVAAVVGNRILVKNEATQANNGVYTVTQVGNGSTPYILTRATDFDSAGTGVDQIDAGDFFLVTAGSTQSNTSWVQQTPLPITVGTTALVFTQFAAPVLYSAGTGLTLAGTVFSITNTGVTASTYGSASSVPVIAVNAQGQATSVTNTSIAIAASQITSGTVTVAQGGTGATTLSSGYLVKGNGTSAVSASVVYDDGTNVGIGTASITAGYKLDVSGSANASGSFVSGGGTTSQAALGNKTLEFYNTGAGEGLIKSSDDTSSFNSIGVSKTTLRFLTSNAERMRLDSSGKLFLGTTAGGGFVNIRETDTNLEFNTTASNVGMLAFNRTTSAYKTINFRGSDFTFNVNDVEKIRIDTVGNLGLNTTTPAGRLSVVSGSSAGAGTAVWSSNHSVFGPNAGSTTGAAIALGYNTSIDAAELFALAPSVAWKPLNIYSNQLTFNTSSGGYGASLNGSGSFTAGGDVRAPIFYDSNNTAFFVDPAGGSRLSAVYVTGGDVDPSNIGAGVGIGNIYEPATSFAAYGVAFGSGAGQHGAIVYGSNIMYFGTENGSDNTMAVKATLNSSGTFTASGDVRAPIFYDADNTTYYIDPASGSNLVGQVQINGGTIMSGGWNRALYLASQFPVIVMNSGSVKYSAIGVDYSEAQSGMVFWVNGNSADITNGSATVALRINTGNFVSAAGSFRAPLYYDSDNTAYYIDAAGTSNLVGLTVANTITGNAATATNLSTGRTNWVTNGTLSAVVGQLGWKNYGNNHTIFDASASTSPSGSAVNNTNADVAWGGTYPTLMGWNGVNTYGVRVDSARVADSAGAVDFNSLTNKTGGTGTYTTSGDFRAPIFYDSNNTGYYLDPASTSNLYRTNGDGFAASQFLCGTTNYGDQVSASTWYGIGRSDVAGWTPGGMVQVAGYTGTRLRGAYSIIDIDGPLGGNIINFSTGSARFVGDVRAPIYYDSDNTGYYFDGAGTSVANIFSIIGGLFVSDNNSDPYGKVAVTRSTGNNYTYYGLTRSGQMVYGMGIDTSNQFWIGGSTAGADGIRSGSPYFYLQSNGNVFASGAFLAPIFYDSNDTAFYANIAGTSEFNTIQTRGGSGVRAFAAGSASISSQLYFADAGNTRAWNWQLDENNNAALWSYGGSSWGKRLGVTHNSEIYLRNSSGNDILLAYPSTFGYSSAYRTMVLGNQAQTTVCIGVDPIANVSGSFNGTGSGVEVMFKNGVGFITPNSANNGYNFPFSMLDGYVYNTTSIRSAIFYDTDNTAYYVDPSGTSRFSTVSMVGALTVGSGEIASYIYMSDSDEGQRILHCNSNRIGFLTQGGSWGSWCDDDGSWRTDHAVFSPIYYDINNTGYYIDAASNSVLNTLTLGGRATDQAVYYSGFTLDANTMPGNSTGFTYSVNAPYTGPIVRLGETGYSLQLNAPYGGGDRFAFRTRNGDTSAFNSWQYPALYNVNVNGGGALYATIYYDQNNTAYYLDFADGGTSNVNTYFTGLAYFRSNFGSSAYSGAQSSPVLQVLSTDAGTAMFSFHRGGYYAVNMGLDPDNVLRIGGWSAAANRFQMDMSGNLTMAGNVTAYSDGRLKDNVATVANALDLVGQMRGVTYTRKDTGEAGVGVIAQEMLEVLPQVVQQGIGDDDTLSVAYGNLVGVLIEAIKELTARVAELEGK